MPAQTPELIELALPLDAQTDIRATMKLTQQLKEDVKNNIKASEEMAALTSAMTTIDLPDIPVEDTEIVVETLIGNKSTGSKGFAAECNFKQDDVIVSINGIRVSGA